MNTHRPLLTFRQLLRLEDLAGYELTSGEANVDREVRDVVVARAGVDLPSDAVVVAPYRRGAGYEAELLLRKADTSGVVAVVLVGAGRLMLSTRRLAENLRMPLLTLADGDPLHVAWRLSRHVHEPEWLGAELVSGMLHRLRAPLSRLSDLITVVETELNATAAIVNTEGSVVAGVLPETELPATIFNRPVAERIDHADGHLLCVPVFVDNLRRPELWLLAQVPVSHQWWLEASSQALSAAALAVASWTLRQRLAGERDARDRSALLAELVDAAPSLSPRLAERAVQAGWRLDGWHVGIHIRMAGDAGAVVRATPRVRAALHENGLDGPLVEHADGWASWITEDHEPPSASHRAFTAKMREALSGLASDVDVVAGIGRPYAGPAGIVTSLKEAREACLFAGTGRRRHRVEHVDELGVRRVLADWYHAEAFRAYARTLLAPLLDSGEEQLLETLRTYLELESSASSAAAALRIHRNTVAYRINRIEQLLAMNLAAPDNRLVLQLACRVLQGVDDTMPPAR
ncbi:PucR family transcriptional regulator [Phytoactinopolyspora limicola]|uniref:PucR family transcriptional regulator n=1 Tax=Phytoactinopolyspora limicola TaxID=2715536 RepID=UPI00140999ED|nr:helix-turn-helix domain-containing protein [Phytoactinopolyspora limicola]